MDLEGKARAAAEAALKAEPSLADRLDGLARAALVMTMNGWTPQRATLDPAEKWSAGEVVATAIAEDGSTMVYIIHLDPDGENWWHSAEEMFAQDRGWVKGPIDSVAVDEVVERMLEDKQRGKEEIDAEFYRLLEKHVNS